MGSVGEGGAPTVNPVTNLLLTLRTVRYGPIRTRNPYELVDHSNLLQRSSYSNHLFEVNITTLNYLLNVSERRKIILKIFCLHYSTGNLKYNNNCLWLPRNNITNCMQVGGILRRNMEFSTPIKDLLEVNVRESRGQLICVPRIILLSIWFFTFSDSHCERTVSPANQITNFLFVMYEVF